MNDIVDDNSGCNMETDDITGSDCSPDDVLIENVVNTVDNSEPGSAQDVDTGKFDQVPGIVILTFGLL